MKTWPVILCAVLFLAVAGCGNSSKDDNGNTPSDIPVKWVNAVIQKDQAKQWELLAEKTEALNREVGPKNNQTIQDYKLIQWKKDDDTYYYEIHYENPVTDLMDGYRLKVIRTEKGWKKAEYSDPHNFEEAVKKLESEVIKEMQ